jgi:alanine racemase
MPTRPCWVEIGTRAFEDNYRFLQGLAAPDAELMAIVKSDAYGHSLRICAPAAVRAGAKWLGVTSVEEGIAARSLCQDVRVLVIGGVFPGQGPAALEHGLTTVAWEPWQLDELAGAAQAAGAQLNSVPVHLEIDTGMSRQGVGPEGIAAALAYFAPGSPLRLEGVMTHLFAADEADGAVTREQLARLAYTRIGSMWATPPPCWQASPARSPLWRRGTG